MADGILSIGADVSPMVRDVRAAYARLQNEINSNGLSISSSKASRSLSSLTVQSERLSKSLSRSAEVFVSIASVSSAIYGTQRAFVALVQSVRETELAFAQIQSILQASSGNFKQFQKDVFQVANQTGTAFSAAADVANEFARQGLNLNDTLVRTKDALTLVRLSGISTADAVSSLTAIVNTFRNEALNSTDAVERLASVSAAYAVAENDLANALQRTGAAAAESGVEFNQLISIITALQERTARGGAVIGNGLKSIFTRTKSSETLDLLEGLGVAVRNLEGDTLPVLDILTDLSKKFQTLSSSQKSSVTEATAGIYQVNTLQALLADLSSEYSVYAGALNIANNSTNQAATRTAILNETLDALFIRTQNNLQQFNSGMGSLTIEPLVRNILGGLNTVFAEFEKFKDGGIGEILLKGIGEFISGPALVLLGGALFKIGKSFSVGFSGALKDLAAIGGFTNKYAITQAQIEAVLNSQNESHIAIISAAKTEEQQAQAILRVMKMITQETRAQAAYFAATTTNVNRAATGRPIPTRPVRRAAGGFLPQAFDQESQMIKKGVGGASSSAKPVVVKGFNTGAGKETIVANTDEYIIKNYNGSGADAVFNKDMLRSVGGLKNLKFLGDVSRVSAGGFTPNLAGGNVPLRGPKGIIKVEKETIGLAKNLKEYSEANKLMAKELKRNQKILASARKKASIISNQLEQDSFMELSNLTKTDALKPAKKEKLLAQKETFDATVKTLARKEKANAKTLERISKESKIVSTELGRRTREEKKPILAAKKAFEAARSKRSGGVLPLTSKGTPEYEARLKAVTAKRSSRLEEAALLKKFTQEETDKKRNESLRAKAKIAAGTAAPTNTGLLTYDETRKKAELKLQNEAIKKQVEQDLINEGRMQGPVPPKPPDDPEDVLRKKRAKKAQLDAINAKLDAEELEKARKDFKTNQDLQRQAARQTRNIDPNRPVFGTQGYNDTLSSRIAERNRRNDLRSEKIKAQELKAQRSAKYGAALQRGQMGAFGASFLIPLAGEALKKEADEGGQQKIETWTNSLSTATAIFATFPNQIGLIAAAAAGLGIALKGVVDYNSTVGKSAETLKREAQEEANSTNEVVNSVRGYITSLNQLNDAIKSGASSSSIQELTSKSLESLFEIKDDGLRNKVIGISERQFTKEETDKGIDQFSEFQKALEEISDPSRKTVSQKEFGALLRTLDDQRIDGVTKISRLFSGKDENLKGIGYDSASSEIISELIRGVGPSNAISAEPVVDKFLQEGGSFEDLLKGLGLDNAATTVAEWSEKLGQSKGILAETLALDLKTLAINQRRVEAENDVAKAVVVAKEKLQDFSKGVSLSAKILNNNADREFSLKSFRATNNFESGANSVADSFVEAAVAKAEAINEARSKTFNLKESLVSQAGQSGSEARISQKELQERVKGINDLFSDFKNGDIGLKGLMTVVEDASNEEQIGTAEVIEQVSSTGLDLEDSLTKVREKLFASLERIRKSNTANLFGGLGAVSKGNPFEAGNKLFEARLSANEFISGDKPKDKEATQSFNEKGFEISKKLISARLNDLLERISNGLVREDVDSAGTTILSKLEEGLAKGGDKEALGKDAKDQISKLFPEGKTAAKDLANLVSTQARSSFQNDFSKFKSGTPSDVSKREDFKKITQEIENALKSGVPLESISLDPLGDIISKSKDKQSVLDFNLLKGSKSEAEKNISRVRADNDESGISDFGEAVIDKESGKNALSEAADAMIALAGQKDVQDQIRQNTEDAADFLQAIDDKFGALQNEFIESENSVSGRRKALEEVKIKNVQEKVSNSIISQRNLTSRIEAAKAERDETTSIATGYGVNTKIEKAPKASPERIKELEKEIESLEKVLEREIEKTRTLRTQLQVPATPSLASGFLPMDLESSLISKGVGGARSSAKPVLLNGVNTGSGKESIVANTDEYLVRNFRGSKKDAIFNREMVRNIGGFKNLQNMGSVSKVSAGGMLPKVLEKSFINSGVGGARPSASPVLLKNGVTANTDEFLVENFQGSGQDSIFNRDMLKRIGGLQNLKSLGKVSKVAAGGVVPVGGHSEESRLINITQKFSNDNSNENKEIIKILKEISNKRLTDLIKEIQACECGNKTTPAPTIPTPTIPTPAPTIPAPAPTIPAPTPAVPAPAVPAPTIPTPAVPNPLDQYKTPEDKRKEAYNKIIANANATKEERERKSRIIQDTADEAAQKRAGGTSDTQLGKAAAQQVMKRNALLNDPVKNPVAFDTFSGAGVVKENFGMEGDKVANTLNRINDLDGQLGEINAQKSAREKASVEKSDPKSDPNSAPEKIEYSEEQHNALIEYAWKLSTKIKNLKRNLVAVDRTSVIPERQNEINEKIDEWARNMPETYPEESALYRSEGKQDINPYISIDRKVLRKPQAQNRIKELEADLKLIDENLSRMSEGQSLIPMPSNSPVKPALPREVMDSIYLKQNRIENKDGTPAELNRLKEEIEKLKQGSSSGSSQTSLRLDGGRPLEVNVSFNGGQNQEVEKLVNVEFAKFQEQLQRGLDNFARNNKLAPSVVNTA